MAEQQLHVTEAVSILVNMAEQAPANGPTHEIRKVAAELVTNAVAHYLRLLAEQEPAEGDDPIRLVPDG